MALSKEKFLSQKPYYLGRAGGVAFYEHPHHGDEAPIIGIVNGMAYNSDFWELPDGMEAAEWAREIKEGN